MFITTFFVTTIFVITMRTYAFSTKPQSFEEKNM